METYFSVKRIRLSDEDLISYGGPGGHAMRYALCANVHVLCANVHMLCANVDVLCANVDVLRANIQCNADVTFTDSGTTPVH